MFNNLKEEKKHLIVVKQYCPDQFSVINPEIDLIHRTLMYGKGSGSLKVGPRHTY